MQRSRLVEWIARAVGVALRILEVATRDRLAECLILVDAPISHSDFAVRNKPGFAFLGFLSGERGYTICPQPKDQRRRQRGEPLRYCAVVNFFLKPSLREIHRATLSEMALR